LFSGKRTCGSSASLRPFSSTILRFASMRDRHLAGPKAVEAHLVLQGRELAREPLLELGCRQHDLELALEPLGQRFGDLHRLIRLCSFSPEPTSRPATI
jgi:hypothetical protein